MGEQKGGGDTRAGGAAAGRAACFEQTDVDVLRLSNGKYHAGTLGEVSRKIVAATVDYLGGSD